MAGYQFTHYEAYSAKGNAKKRGLKSIAREADRARFSHPHVKTPLPPQYLLGDSFTAAAKAIIEAAEQSRVQHNDKARKLRSDANLAIGLIASYPLSNEAFAALPPEAQQEQRAELEDWTESVLMFAETEFPGLVQVAALHFDEGYPHLHIMIGRTEPTDNFTQIHKGELARRAVQGNDRSGAGKKAGNDAYKAEMRRFQDAYHQEVATYYGQARLGPQRRRLTRARWNQEQAQAEALQRTLRQAAELNAQAHAQAQKVMDDAVDQAEQLIELNREEVQRQHARAEAERCDAERLREEADRTQRHTDALRQQVETAKARLEQQLAKLTRYDGLMGRILGMLGIRQRIEKRAVKAIQQRVRVLERETEALKQSLDSRQSLRVEHQAMQRAMRALTQALTVTPEAYPALRQTGAMGRHLEAIRAVLGRNLSSEELVEALSAQMATLKPQGAVIAPAVDPEAPKLV